MHDMIPHTAPLDDYRVVLARRLLAELPEDDQNDRPWWWIGRLETALRQLAGGWPPGAAGGLSGEQREVLAAALSDAADYRESRASDSYCADCEADPSNLCSDHAADMDLAGAYLLLAGEIGVEVSR